MRKLIAMAGLGLLGLWTTAAHALPCAGFTDVEDTSPFCGNVTWLKNRGVTLGCAPGLYCPADFVSRLQMAAFMNRLGDSLFPLTCAAGQVMKWDGLQWACANDAIGGGRRRHGDQRPRRHRPSGQPEPDHRGGIDLPCPGVSAAASV